MSFSNKSHERIGQEFLDPDVQLTKIDCQAADDGMTEQAHKDEVSIQNIVKRAQRGEQITTLQNQQWGVDTIGQPSFDEAQDVIAKTKAAFEQLPAEIRSKCGNNAGNFLDYYMDINNYDELKDSGIDISHLSGEYDVKIKAEEALRLAAEKAAETPPAV